MNINKIAIKEPIEFLLEKNSHNNYPVRTITPNNYSREKTPYKLFELFPKNFSIKLEPITVIVGENGSGKSTFLNQIKDFIGAPPDKLTLLLNEFKNEDEYLLNFIKKQKKFNLKIESKDHLTYKNTIIFCSEKDNPLIVIPKMLNPDDKSFPNLVHNLFNVQEESHGETMIPLLEYILNVQNCFICLDEPETALSLKNQIKISNLIKESVNKNNNQIVICTHSLAMINCFDKIYDMEKREWTNRKEYVESIIKN